MFLIQDENRLPLQSALVGDGAGVWAVLEQWTPGDLLVLRVAQKRTREIPRVVWMDLTRGAASLNQFLDGASVVRGAAVVSTRQMDHAENWHLDPLSEIRVGASEYSESHRKLLTVTQFTTTEGRKFSVPHGFATGYARGRRVWRAHAEK
ncbi:hypothetical protein [Cupriavidus pauculus]|uniref:hypothetical protein n=1 Tax=Cupriavidus pauculus TaxID=82633 RepID=UPI001EE2912B|nr:hypothetical protein [Cupriavidus pauculus]GJG94340.1 hypothetical protein CBA19C6_07645 [Cupriavidus pauculus]